MPRAVVPGHTDVPRRGRLLGDIVFGIMPLAAPPSTQQLINLFDRRERNGGSGTAGAVVRLRRSSSATTGAARGYPQVVYRIDGN
jgi:hypothetical protein